MSLASDILNIVEDVISLSAELELQADYLPPTTRALLIDMLYEAPNLNYAFVGEVRTVIERERALLH